MKTTISALAIAAALATAAPAHAFSLSSSFSSFTSSVGRALGIAPARQSVWTGTTPLRTGQTLDYYRNGVRYTVRYTRYTPVSSDYLGRPGYDSQGRNPSGNFCGGSGCR